MAQFGPQAAVPNPEAVSDALARALRSALMQWKSLAYFQGVTINGAIAIGPPGCLQGPRLIDLMAAHLGPVQGSDRVAAEAAAKALEACFEGWRRTVSVPGLPWYPGFTTVPSGFAAPTPNVPTPLSALASVGFGDLSTGPQLARMIMAPLSPEMRNPNGYGTFFTLFANKAALVFREVFASAMVVNAMGQGPVVGFAPPGSPVGQVAGGMVTPTPGVLA